MQITTALVQGLIALLFLLYAPASFSRAFEYENLSNAKHWIVIEVASPSFISGDRAVDAYVCGEKDKYVCINSESFNFSVPIDVSSKTKRWEQGGHHFELVGYKQIRFRGAKRKFFHIRSVQDGMEYRYFYSRKYGLVKFRGAFDGGSTFISRGKRGFGFR